MKLKTWSDHGSNIVPVPAVKRKRTDCRVISYSGQVDYDGDEMAAMLASDREMVRLLEPLKPHKSAHSITSYRTMSGNFSLPKPVIAMLSAAVAKPDTRETSPAMDEFLV